MSFSTALAGLDTTLPQSIINRQSDATLRSAALSAFALLAPGMDTVEGSFAFDLIEPFCLVLAQAYIDLIDVERRNSLSTATGLDLDRMGDLYAVTRAPAANATGYVTFSGTVGSPILAGTQVSTLGNNAQFFMTQVAAVISADFTVTVPVTAMQPGVAGNVPAASVTLFAGNGAPAGISSVTNAAAMVGGADIQPDGSPNQYYTGYRADIFNLENTRGEGGASKHLRKWARSVAGVGGVHVLEVTPTAGWATVVVLGDDMLPASADIVHATEAAILDPWYLYNEIESVAFTLTGAGATLASQPDATPLAGTNNCVLLHGAVGGIRQLRVDQMLPQPGIWRLKPRMKVSSNALGTNLVTFGIQNNNTGTLAYQRPNNQGGFAQITLAANRFSTGFVSPDLDSNYVDFVWNGYDSLDLHIDLAGVDVSTGLYVDQVNYFAAMSRDDRDVGMAPAGMRVNVIPATGIPVNISATIKYQLTTGQTVGSVNSSIAANLTAYFQAIAFTADTMVRRAAVEEAIYSTIGVGDVNNVVLNGVAQNITLLPTQVAALGTQTWTAV